MSPPKTADRAQVYSAALSELRDYLAMWQRSGYPAAARRFLVPSQRGNGLTLRSGTLISYRPYRWVSSGHFTLLVTLDLHFTGSQGAWNVGMNTRFVTFSRTAAQGPYLLEFDTGP